MKRIIYTNEDGGVSIVVPSPQSNIAIEEIAAKDVPDGVSFEIVDTATIPFERTFRNAWRKNGKAVQTDMPAAREIAHTIRRDKREAMFAPLDIEATIPAKAIEAEAARQVIRDADSITQIEINDSSTEAKLLSALDIMEQITVMQP